jgi:hypothetical protein
LNTPFGGIITVVVVFAGGLNTPSAPVPPLLKLAALAKEAVSKIIIPAAVLLRVALSMRCMMTSFNVKFIGVFVVIYFLSTPTMGA